MPEPKVRFKRDDGSSYPAWKEYAITDLFTKISNKNKDGQNTNVITNSAEFGLIPQRDYFDKNIAVEGNTGNYTIIQTGDFVYNPRKSTYAPMGPFNCYRLADDGIVSPLYSCLRPKGVLDSEYLLWYFQTDKWYGYVNDHGAQNGARHDRVGMTDKILMGIPVKAPCEEEQQKIADFLSTVDEVISTSEAEVTNLEKQKKAVMKKIFSQEVRFKRADGSDFPEWKEKSLGSIAEIKDSARVPNELWKTEGVPYYRAKDFNSGNLNSELFISYDDYIKYKKTTGAPELGDLMFVSGGNVGLCVLKKTNEPIYVQGGAILYVRTSISVCLDGEYLLQYFSSEKAKNYIKNASVGGTITHFTLKPANNMPVELPCPEEQRLIADFLFDFDEAIAAAKKELELWKELKKGLLQQMFV